MLKLLSLLTVMVAAAATPGPNNLIVLTTSSRAGFRAALPSIAGVAAGSLVMLLVLWTGAALFVDLLPRLRLAIGALGCLYLAWLGLALIRHAGRGGGQVPGTLPTGAAPMALFQLLNPKTWMFMSAVIAAGLADPADIIGLPLLAVLVPLVMVGCLSLWAGVGTILTRRLADPMRRAWFDRVMGLLLLVSAPLILL